MKTTFTSLKIVSLTVALFSVIHNPSQAQWQQLTGFKGEPVSWIRGTSTELFSVTSNGVLGSSNSGNQWNVIQDLYLTNTVEKISASGDTIVAFAYPESYLSVDNGLNWTEIDNPLTSFQITGIIIENGMLYAATAGDYLYSSANLGVSWTQITQNFGSNFINSVTAEGNIVFASTEDGLYRSANAGNTFTQVLLPGISVNRAYVNGNYVFAYSSLQGIYKSSDNGVTWQIFQPAIGLPYLEILDFCLDGNKIFAAAFDDLIVSDTGSFNWTPVNYNNNIDLTFSIYKKGSTLFAGTNRGVFSSVNQGVTWSESNDGIIPVGTEALTLLNDTLFVGSNVYGISNYTASGWGFSGLGLRNTFDLITRGSDIYTASDFGIYKSSNSGNNWTLINSTPGNPYIAFCPKVDVSDSLVIGAALQYGILRSGDYGVTWSFENTGMSSALISCVAISGSNIIVGTYSNGLYTSTDAGLTWLPSGAPGEFISDLTTIGNNVVASSYALSGNFISTDNGATWNAGPVDFLEDLSTSGNIVLGSSYGYIMLSLDSGQTFQNLTPAPAGTQVVGSVASATEVYVGTNYDGVWKITISEILSISEQSAESLIAHIHPNVFQSEAMVVIDEKLAAESPEFIITDVNGKVIQKIQLNQPRTKIYADKMNSGIYFFTVQSKSGSTGTGKFVVYK